MTLASILIRTRNEGATLAQVLRAVQGQSERDFEIIVVDSGSSDDTISIAESFAAQVIRIPQASFSYGYALNTGIKHSRGEFVVSLSGHAIPCDGQWLASLLQEFDDPLVAGSSSVQIPENVYYTALSRAFFQSVYQAGILRTHTLCRFLFHCASSAIRRSVWEQTLFDNDLAACEDHAWALQVTRMGYKITHCPASRVIHSHALSPLPRTHKALKETFAIWRIYLGL